MTSPAVSIITPVFNGVDVLSRCLRSVARQTYPDVEHVVVDGGSSDGTVEILEAARGVAWKSEPDEGQTDALRKGFAMARGEVLTWLCADDELTPDSVSAVMSLLGDKSIALAFGSVDVVSDGLRATLPAPGTLDRSSFRWGNPIAQPGTLFRRDLYEEIGGLDTSVEFGMDHNLWVRLVNAGGRGRGLSRVVATYHVDDTSKTGRTSPARFLHDEARTYAFVGWDLEHLIAVGRRAAYLSLSSEVPSLDVAIGMVDAEFDLTDLRMLRRIARTELAKHAEATGRCGLRYLLSPGIHVDPATRGVARELMRRQAGRILGLRRGAGPTVEQVIQGARGGDRFERQG